jgi:hypothetical protein
MTLFASWCGNDVIPDSRRPPRDRTVGVRLVRRPRAGRDEVRR